MAALLAIAARSTMLEEGGENTARNNAGSVVTLTKGMLDMVVGDEDDLPLWKELKKQVKILREEAGIKE